VIEQAADVVGSRQGTIKRRGCDPLDHVRPQRELGPWIVGAKEHGAVADDGSLAISSRFYRDTFAVVGSAFH
jgi:hypothetical protein